MTLRITTYLLIGTLTFIIYGVAYFFEVGNLLADNKKLPLSGYALITLQALNPF